ncbi:FecCD family ABC transporter permease [Fluviispira multicolorata]|uniref:Iron chelate uptake ABC transporter family permease subunit n=1 Tax=Fluviispira multicolorata TaxID=2654512 RepID=A0A833JDV6_9BACT|nr:iron ABC transporter permease [Fluviispira multicolorata]KAB8030947.1 iron chelate uptake ABC transporter family permease subunit [Fluviispira multicolorata]
MKSNFSIKVFIVYLMLLLISAFFSIYYGSVNISFMQFFSSSSELEDIPSKILELRINSLLQAALVGAILALSGCVLQRVLRNPLADPFILGISSGGTCFLSLSILINYPPLFSIISSQTFIPIKSFHAFIGCIVSFLILFSFRRKIKTVNDEYVYPVIGIIINSFFSAILMMVITIAKPEQLAEIHNLMIGTLQPITFNQIFFFYAMSIFPIIFILRNAKYFDFMIFGDDFSKSLGINSLKIRCISIVMICILVSLVVSTAGSIGFIGLIIPHMIRKIHRFSPFFECILCMQLGAIILINADTLSRSLFSPAQLPLGIFTAILGAPILAFILIRKQV